MANKSIYRITVTNFNNHNSSLKRGHKSTLISNNFCSDSKVGVLPLTVRWMFLGLILACGDHTRDTIELNERQLRDLLESSWSIDRALDALQELKLLSYSKNGLFINRIEKKRKEKKLTSTEEEKSETVPDDVFINLKIEKEENKQLNNAIDLIKPNPTIAFQLRMTMPEHVAIMDEFKIPIVKYHKHMGRIVERFPDAKDLREAVENICSTKVYLDLKKSGTQVRRDSYFFKAFDKEIGAV